MNFIPIVTVEHGTRLKSHKIQTYLKFPQASNVIVSFKAGGLQTLIEAALEGSQSTDPSSNHSDPLPGHALAG